MAHSPLEQFRVKTFVPIELFGYDLSLTNSSMFMLSATILVYVFFAVFMRKMAIVPSRTQALGEMVFSFISDMTQQNIGEKGKKFIPFIFSLFVFVLVCNLLGMVPYGYTVMSNVSVTFAMAMAIFCLMIFLGFFHHGLHFFSIFLPKGTPWWLAPLMILIELFAFLSRPVSLSLRLTANMVAGHVLLEVMAGFIVSLAIYIKIFPFALTIALIGFEFFVALLQAYIFSILTCVYLNDSLNMH